MNKRSFEKSSEEKVLEMRKMFIDGLSTVQIGKKLNISHTTVLYWAGRLKKKPKNFIDYDKFKITSEMDISERFSQHENKSYSEYLNENERRERIKRLRERRLKRFLDKEAEEREKNNKKFKEKLFVFRNNKI